MATPKVQGGVLSEETMRVFICLYEKGLEFEFVPVNLGAGEHNKEPFIYLNPFGLVSASKNGDLKMFNETITQHIGHENLASGTQLIIPDSKKMTIMSVWMEVEAHHFESVSSVLAWELVFKSMLFGMAADVAIVEENKDKLGKVLDVYETKLGESKYLGGDCFSLANLHHLPNIHYLMGMQAKKLFESCPNVSSCCADIMVHPAWSKILDMQKKQ